MRNPKLKRNRYGKFGKFEFNRKVVFVVALVFGLVGYLVFRVSQAGSSYTNFIDISSPQCSSLEGKSFQQFGIVGLNGTYMNFGTNPCLMQEVRLFAVYDLYVGANYPSGPCAGLSPYDCGKKAGQHNLDLIKWFGLRPTKLWIDVENGPSIPWSTQSNNWSFLSGMYDKMRSAYQIGFYSNQNMWQQITGGVDLAQKFSGGVTNWYATGRTNAADAKAYCGTRFGNAPNQYVQFVYNGQVDVNLSCP